jgi:hypothetical protein
MTEFARVFIPTLRVWNDAPKRTAHDVLRLLNTAATMAEQWGSHIMKELEA